MTTPQGDADMIDEACVALLKELWKYKGRHQDTPDTDDLRYNLLGVAPTKQIREALNTYINFRNDRAHYRIDKIDYVKLYDAIFILSLWLKHESSDVDTRVILLGQLARSLCIHYAEKSIATQYDRTIEVPVASESPSMVTVTIPSDLALKGVNVHITGTDPVEDNTKATEVIPRKKLIPPPQSDPEADLTLCTDEYKSSLSGLSLEEIRKTHSVELKGAKIKVIDGKQAGREGIANVWTVTGLSVLLDGDNKISLLSPSRRITILDWNRTNIQDETPTDIVTIPDLSICTEEYKRKLSGLSLSAIKESHKTELKGATIRLLDGKHKDKVVQFHRWDGTTSKIVMEDGTSLSIGNQRLVDIIEWNK
jgi:hypothetical protein